MLRRVAGKWRIVEMDLWDREAIDLVGPAFIEFSVDGRGSFRFIAVEGYLDCRQAEHGQGAGVEDAAGGRLPARAAHGGRAGVPRSRCGARP